MYMSTMYLILGCLVVVTVIKPNAQRQSANSIVKTMIIDVLEMQTIFDVALWVTFSDA